MKPDQSDLEDREEITKHIAGSEKGVGRNHISVGGNSMCKDPMTGVSIIHSQNKHETEIQKVRGNMVSLGGEKK